MCVGISKLNDSLRISQQKDTRARVNDTLDIRQKLSLGRKTTYKYERETVNCHYFSVIYFWNGLHVDIELWRSAYRRLIYNVCILW